MPPALARLVKALCRLPGIGEKTATRLALRMLQWPAAQAGELAQAISELHEKIGLCSSCFTFSEEDPCPICRNHRRDTGLICVVEEPGDLVAIEKAGAYRGLYHVLHGAFAPIDGIGPDELKIRELISRIETSRGTETPVREVILATSSTAGGEATASYLGDVLAGAGVKVSRIACGIPMGMDIKYADTVTLQRALDSRHGV